MAKSTRAARRRAVSSARRSRSSWGWYALSAVVVVAGVALILANRSEPAEPTTTQHWHAAFGVNVCGEWLPNPETFEYSAANSSQIAGIHTHGDGLIHIHPHVTSEAGENATIGKFFSYGGWEADENSFTVWDGQEHKTGDMCGDEEATVRWELNGEPHDGSITSYRPKDGDIIALALLPEDQEIGDPPAVAQLQDPLAAEGGPGTVAPTVQPPLAPDATAPAGETPTSVAGETPPTDAPTGETSVPSAP
jgi:hypothetical protein